jgi:hypothetical protein
MNLDYKNTNSVALRELSRRNKLIILLFSITNQRRLVLIEINLVSWAVCEFVVYGFDYGVHDFSAVHADADVVADFGRFDRHEISLADESNGATAPSAVFMISISLLTHFHVSANLEIWRDVTACCFSALAIRPAPSWPKP